MYWLSLSLFLFLTLYRTKNEQVALVFAGGFELGSSTYEAGCSASAPLLTSNSATAI